MTKFHAVALAVLFLLAAAGAARADDYTVDSPEVSQGWSGEANLNYSLDNVANLNRYSSQVYGLNYGFNDHFATGIAAMIEGTSQTSAKVTNFRWESQWSPYRPGEKFIDIGAIMTFDFALADSQPDTVEGKLLLEKKIEDFTLTGNMALSRNFGPNTTGALEGGYSMRVKYHINDYAEPGLEYYSDLGSIANIDKLRRQDNVFGPVLQGQWGPVAYDTGALFGVSDSAHDATFKLNLEYDF